MSLWQNILDRYIVKPTAERMIATMGTQKAEGPMPAAADFQQWSVPIGYNDQIFTKRKPDTQTTYQQLRNLSQLHDVSRACINIRKREITQLEWDIVTADDSDQEKLDKEIPAVKAFFSTIGGYNTKMRKLLDIMVEDYLVIDAVTLYRRRTRGGAFLGLLPVDPTTIKMRVTEAGTTPLPPEKAYEQWIHGAKIADFTAEELVYDMLNPRSNTPYGFSVIEALILTIEAALRSAMYSVSYFTDGNMPEGFFGLPEKYTVDQIRSFQDHFDALLAGDQRGQRKVKFMPSGGTGFTATKQFDFQGIKPYNEWLMKITASLFGVMPSELGFTETVNKATSVEQTEVSKRNSIGPMTMAIEQLFNEILWSEQLALTDKSGKVVDTIGPFPQLRFKFLATDIRDEVADAQVASSMINTGALSVDEWRQDKGKPAIGLDHYIMTPAGPILVADFLKESGQPKDETRSSSTEANNTQEQQALETTPLEELDKWERKAIKDVKDGRTFRKFSSNVLDQFTLINVGHELQDCVSESEVKNLFKAYKNAARAGVLKDAERLIKRLETIK